MNYPRDEFYNRLIFSRNETVSKLGMSLLGAELSENPHKHTKQNITSDLGEAFQLCFSVSSVRVSYAKRLSASWTACRGFDYTGVFTFAYPFRLYLDADLCNTDWLQYGCWFGKINIQAYADVLVVFYPSASGLHCLLRHLETVMGEYESNKKWQATRSERAVKSFFPHSYTRILTT